MQTESYMQRERRLRQERRIKRIAKTISLLIILGTPFVFGFVIGRVTKATPVQAPVLQEEINTPEIEYHPDPCGLEVVVCPGEEN